MKQITTLAAAILLAMGLAAAPAFAGGDHHMNPCNPCSMKGEMKHNPCSMKGEMKHNPCSMKGDMKHNPCSMKGDMKHNPCSMKDKEDHHKD